MKSDLLFISVLICDPQKNSLYIYIVSFYKVCCVLIGDTETWDESLFRPLFHPVGFRVGVLQAGQNF